MQSSSSTTSSYATDAPRSLFLNRNFVFLWFAYGIAALGDHLSELALLKERGGLDRPDATRIQALITFGFFLPFVVFGPIAGWWSDRFSRKLTMIAADVGRAVIVFSLAFLVVQLERWLEPARYPGAPTWIIPFSTLPHPETQPVPGVGDFAIVVPLLLVGVLAAFFSPARQALLPTLIREDQLVRANAMINALGTIGGILGAVIGGWLVENAGIRWNFRVNALTFILSAVFVSLIVTRVRSAPVTNAPRRAEGLLTPLVEGFRYVGSHRRVLQLILLGVVFWAAAGVVSSMIPAIVREVFHGGMAEIGMYRGLLVIGLAVGAAVMSIFGPALPHKLAVLAALLGAGAWVLALDVCFLVFGGEPGAAGAGRLLGAGLTGLCLFGIGGAGAALLVTITSSIQHFVPDERRGRVFGVADMATMGAMVAATGALGIPEIPNLDRYIPHLLGGTGAMLLGAAAVSYAVFRRGDPLPAFTSFLWLILKFGMRFWNRLARVGPCTVPRSGPVILAANHTSGIDALAILGASTRLCGFLVEREYYEPWLARFFMRVVGCIPVSREKPEKRAMVECLHMLERGGALGIFPQGTYLPPDANPEPPRDGVGVLALRSVAVVIPVFIQGATYDPRPFASLRMRHAVKVRFGRPVSLDDLRARPRDRDAAAEATRRIMAAIDSLK